MFIPEYVKNQKDRAYTTQEISQLLKFCDERAKALVLLFASTGIRICAVPDLKLKYLQKIPEHNLYQISVYYGFKEEYYCFTTPEAANAIDDYLQYRERCGETLTKKSYLFREQFDVNDEQIRKKPKQIINNTIQKLLSNRLHRSGVLLIEEQKEGDINARSASLSPELMVLGNL